MLSEGEAQRLMEILADKAGIVQDTWHKVGPPPRLVPLRLRAVGQGPPPHPTWSQVPSLPGTGPAAQKVLETPLPASLLLLPGMLGESVQPPL